MIEIPDKKTFHPRELAVILQLSRSTVYQKISEGKIEAVFTSSRRTVVTREALLRYLGSVENDRLQK